MRKLILLFIMIMVYYTSLFSEPIFPELLFPELLFLSDNSKREFYTIDNQNDFNRIKDSINRKRDLCYIILTIKNIDDNKIVDSIINSIERQKYIIDISFHNCNFKELPYSMRKLDNLTGMHFFECDSLITLDGFNSTSTLFLLTFIDCRINELPEGTEKIKSMLYLMLDFPNDFSGFDLNKELDKFSRRKNILNLCIKYKLLDKFPDSLFKLTNIQTLLFYSDSKLYFPPRFDELNNLVETNTSNCNNNVINSISKGENYNFGSYNEYGIIEEKNNKEYKKYKIELCDKPKLSMLYKPDQRDKETYHLQSNMIEFIYSKNRIYNNLNIEYKFYNREILLNLDTANATANIKISNIGKNDSVKVYLTKDSIMTAKPFINYEYTNDGILLDFKEFDRKYYFLHIDINKTNYIIRLIFTDNLSQKQK